MRWLFCLILSFTTAHAKDSVNISLVSTEYVLPSEQTMPSCQIFYHRRREREKVLREKLHNLKVAGFNVDLFLKDQYITNKFFLEKQLWRDELVTMINTWELPEGLQNELKTLGAQTFLRLNSDGIDWQEKMLFFPQDVLFFVDENKKTLQTQHQIYYADYCKPGSKSQLTWFPSASLSPLSSQSQLEQLLKFLKEN